MGQAPDYPEPVFVMPEQKRKCLFFKKFTSVLPVIDSVRLLCTVKSV